MKRVITFEKLDVAFAYASFYVGAFCIAFALTSAVMLSALTVGYGLADIVYAATAPPDWSPKWDYATNTVVWELTKNVESKTAFTPCVVPDSYFDNAYQCIITNPTNEVLDCGIPPFQDSEEAAYPIMDVQENEDIPPPDVSENTDYSLPDVQVNEVKAVNTVYIKPSP